VRPAVPALFPSDDPGDYDAAGCLRWLNEFAEEHNRALGRMLGWLPSGPAAAAVVYVGDSRGRGDTAAAEMRIGEARWAEADVCTRIFIFFFYM